MIKLGDAEIYFDEEGLLVSVYPDGFAVQAHPHDTEEYRAMANDMGYGDDLGAMCRDHELTHHLLAEWLGQPFSLSMKAVSTRKPEEGSRLEEAAVLAIQRYARALGLSLEQIARERCSQRK